MRKERNKDDGGPAFPRTSDALDPDCNPRYLDGYPGMTLRDWFAGQIIGHLDTLLSSESSRMSAQDLSVSAYLIADAMLKERSKE